MSNYQLRNLKTKDIFAVSRIIKEMELKFNFAPGLTAEQVGMEVLTKVLASLGDAEDSVAAFLGDLVGITAEEFNELPLEDSFDIIKAVKDIPTIDKLFTTALKQNQA